jgi:hypothetical protein
LEIIILLNATDYLLYIIRTYDDYAIFGNSTNDLILINYTKVEADEVSKLLLPRRSQTPYSTAGILEYFLVKSLTNKPPSPRTISPSQPASTLYQLNRLQSSNYKRAEVHSFLETGLWSAPFDLNTSDVASTHPRPFIPHIRSLYIGYPEYVQLLVNFSFFVLITDAPPHCSKILLQWIAGNIGKPVRYVAPSHHHHDHD